MCLWHLCPNPPTENYISIFLTDLFLKSHKALVQYPTIHHSEHKFAHFCFKWAIVRYETGALWDLWNWSIDNPMRPDRFMIVLWLNVSAHNSPISQRFFP